jgi:hypothetical protein
MRRCVNVHSLSSTGVPFTFTDDGASAKFSTNLVGSLKMNTTLEYSTRVVQEGDRRCKKSTLNDLAYLTPLRIPLMNPVTHKKRITVYCTLLYSTVDERDVGRTSLNDRV